MSTYTLELSEESTKQLDNLAATSDVATIDLLREKIEQWLAWEREAITAHREGIRQIEEGRSYSSQEVRARLDAVIRARHAA